MLTVVYVSKYYFVKYNFPKCKSYKMLQEALGSQIKLKFSVKLHSSCCISESVINIQRNLF